MPISIQGIPNAGAADMAFDPDWSNYDKIFVTVLNPDEWHPTWFCVPERNIVTEHSPSIGYRNVLLQCGNRQYISWIATRNLSRFCWDEQEQTTLLERLSGADPASQQARTY